MKAAPVSPVEGFSSPLRIRGTALAASLVLSALTIVAGPASAAWTSLNMIFVNQTGLPDNQVFITFQDSAQSLAATYGGGTAVSRKNPGDVMTQSYSLETLGSTGFNITNAAGPVVFVSYAATTAVNGFEMSGDLSGNSQPSYIGSGGANYYKAYQPFEITADSGATNGQGNLTNINYFAAPIAITSYSGGVNGTKLQTRGYYGGTANGTATIAAALKTLTGGNALAQATLTTGQLLRYIGPSSFGAGTNPYPTFDAYLGALHTAVPPIKIQNSNAFNTQQNPTTGNVNYNYTLDFTGTVAADNTITLTGKITTEITNFGGSPTTGPEYDNLTLTISPTVGANTSENIFNNTIYGQADPLGSGNGSTTFSGANWTTLANDMAAAGLYLNTVAAGTTYATTQSLLIGEITTGLLGGFVGSGATYSGGTGAYAAYDGMKYYDVPSVAWWNTAAIPSPTVLQPDHPYYSAYSETIFEATDNEVYSIPFSDRFGTGPLMQTQLYNSDVVDTWVVTLGRPLFLPDPTPTPAPAKPTVKVNGKKTYKTTKSKVELKGSTNASATKVEIKVRNKAFKTTKVSNKKWSFKASLAKGKNKIQIRAINSAGAKSSSVILNITRK